MTPSSGRAGIRTNSLPPRTARWCPRWTSFQRCVAEQTSSKSSYRSQVNLEIVLQDMSKPDEEEVEKTVRDTKEAMERLVAGKLNVAQPTTLAPQPGGPTYIKYTPAQQGPQYNSGASQRIIKMQDLPVRCLGFP